MEQQQAQAFNNEQLWQKLCALENLLMVQAVNEQSRMLWDIQQVANYFQCSYAHTYRSIISDPRFPAPVDIEGRTGGRSKNMYIAGEVVQFCLKYRKKKERL